METINFSFRLQPTDPTANIGFELWLDQKLLKDIAVVDCEHNISIDVDLEPGLHDLVFVMKNKTIDHTKIDEHNNIIKDALLKIDNFVIDEMNVNQSIWLHSKYHHDFNGTADPIVDVFSGLMGCNGKVQLEFETPIYLWLLKKL